MRKHFTIFLIIIFILGLVPVNFSSAEDLSNKLSGRILLQVESVGQAWYIDPGTKQRAFLGRPADAFQIMRELGLGISEKDYNLFNGCAPQNLSGRILLRVEANGEAYYVNPTDLKMYYLGRPADAFKVMREKGLGITNEDLTTVPVFQKYKEQTEANTAAIDSLNQKIEEQQNQINELKQIVNTNTSTSTIGCIEDQWVCSSWGSCSAEGTQKRLCSLLEDCQNISTPSPITSQNCSANTNSCIADTWSCDAWSKCTSSGQQTRMCNLTFDCPNINTPSWSTTQSCTQTPEVAKEIRIEKDTGVESTRGKYYNITIYYYENGVKTKADVVAISSDDNGYFSGSGYKAETEYNSRYCIGGEAINSDGTQRKGNPLSCPTSRGGTDGGQQANFYYFPSATGLRTVTVTINGKTVTSTMQGQQEGYFSTDPIRIIVSEAKTDGGKSYVPQTAVQGQTSVDLAAYNITPYRQDVYLKTLKVTTNHPEYIKTIRFFTPYGPSQEILPDKSFNLSYGGSDGFRIGVSAKVFIRVDLIDKIPTGTKITAQFLNATSCSECGYWSSEKDYLQPIFDFQPIFDGVVIVE